MLHLIVKSTEGGDRAIPIERGELIIGRGSECDVVLDSGGVSRRHARIYTFEDRVFIEDLGSEGGIFVSGRKVERAAVLKPGSAIIIDTFSLVVEDRETAGPGAEWGRLAGKGAPIKGRMFLLERTEMFAGRSEDNDIVIADESVAKRHAVLRLRNGMPQVVDLDTPAGTWVGGKRVKEAAVTGGSRIRFGKVEAEFKAPKPRGKDGAAQGVTKAASSRIILLAAFAALVLIVVAVALKRHADQEALLEQRVRDHASMQAPDPLAERLERARANLGKERWEDAVSDANVVLDMDPLNADAKGMKARAASEIEARKSWDEAETYYGLGKIEEAVRSYLKIPQDSVYASRAAPRLRDARVRAAASEARELKARARRMDPVSLHDAAAGILDKDPDNADALKLVREAEAQLRKRRIAFEEWRPGSGSGSDPGTVLRGAYPDDRLRRCVVLYHRGKADEALRELEKIARDRKAGALQGDAARLQKDIFTARGKFTEAQGQMLQGNVREAAKFARIVLDADSNLVPPSPPSYYRSEVSRILSESYLKTGAALFQKGRYEEAYEQFKAAREIAPESIDVVHAMKKLEIAAERMFEEAVTADLPPAEMNARMEQIRSMTQPGSSVYRMATDRLSTLP